MLQIHDATVVATTLTRQKYNLSGVHAAQVKEYSYIYLYGLLCVVQETRCSELQKYPH